MSSMERCYCLQCVLRSDATVYNVSWGEWNSCLQCVLRSDSDVYSVMNINNAMPVYLSTYLPVYLSSCIHIYLSTEKEKASLTVSATNTLSENIFHFQIGFKITGGGGYCIWYTCNVKQYPKHCQVILYCPISNSAPQDRIFMYSTINTDMATPSDDGQDLEASWKDAKLGNK